MVYLSGGRTSPMPRHYGCTTGMWAWKNAVWYQVTIAITILIISRNLKYQEAIESVCAANKIGNIADDPGRCLEQK